MQHIVRATVGNVLDLSCRAFVSLNEPRRRLTTVEREVARAAEKRRTLEAKLRDAKLKLGLMEGWEKRVTDAEQMAAASLLQVAELQDKLGKVAEKRNRLESQVRQGRVWTQVYQYEQFFGKTNPYV